MGGVLSNADFWIAQSCGYIPKTCSIVNYNSDTDVIDDSRTQPKQRSNRKWILAGRGRIILYWYW